MRSPPRRIGRIDELPDTGCWMGKPTQMTMPAQGRATRVPRTPKRPCATAGVACAPLRQLAPAAGPVASRWMRRDAQRGMVATDGPENRYKDSSRMTHG